jgi:hypothetical protein
VIEVNFFVLCQDDWNELVGHKGWKIAVNSVEPSKRKVVISVGEAFVFEEESSRFLNIKLCSNFRF